MTTTPTPTPSAMSRFNVASIANRMRSGQDTMANTYLVYGPPTSGKTFLAGTICQLPFIKRVWWFDLEKGITTLPSAQYANGEYVFSQEDLAKIIHFDIEDQTRASCFYIDHEEIDASVRNDKSMAALAAELSGGIPRAADTLMRLIAAKKTAHYYDMETARIVEKANDNTILFDWAALTPEDAVVIDNGSQFSASLMSYVQLFNPKTREPRQWYNAFYGAADAFLSRLQTAKCHVIMTCHSQYLEENPKKKRQPKVVPTFGSKNYSWSMPRFFGNKIYLDIVNRDIQAISLPTTRTVVLAGSRLGIDTSAMASVTMADIMGLTTRAKESAKRIVNPASSSPTAATSAANLRQRQVRSATANPAT